MSIYSVNIKNFKSIRDSGEILLKPINILIGPNGAGKSNFISYFEFLQKIATQQIQFYIAQNGRADNFLYHGLTNPAPLSGSILFLNKNHYYTFTMVQNKNSGLVFSKDMFDNSVAGSAQNYDVQKNDPYVESEIFDNSTPQSVFFRKTFERFSIFHFQDTGFTSPMRHPCNTRDYAYLRNNGGNIAAFLYRLQEASPKEFNLIVKIIQSVAPFINRFLLKPDEINPQQIFLRWYENGSDKEFFAHNLSDGTLRFICLAVLLLQPEPPETIIIDEPELGLHPFAINLLAAMIKTASVKSQVIISTQSVSLMNEFEPDDIIVVEREDNQTVFKRQNAKSLQTWLEDYSVGELWEMNILGGRPK